MTAAKTRHLAAYRCGVDHVTQKEQRLIEESPHNNSNIATGSERGSNYPAPNRPKLSCFVAGKPQPQGSARAFCHNGRAIVTSDNAKLKPWRKAMRTEFEAQYSGEPMDGALREHLVFIMPRLASLSRKSTRLPYTGRDLDKLVRAVNDSLTDAGVIRDDSRICKLTAIKRYAALDEVCGVQVSVTTMDEKERDL